MALPKQREIKLCGKRLKRQAVLLGLSLLFWFSPLSSFCFAEVKLTDEEATELLSTIQESKKDLEGLKSQLETAETQLNAVKKDYSEQKTYYETQLAEAEKSNEQLKTAVTVTSTATAVLLVVLFAVLFI